jgi:hypothetical protein
MQIGHVRLRLDPSLARELAEVLHRHSGPLDGFYITPVTHPRRRRGLWALLLRALRLR